MEADTTEMTNNETDEIEVQAAQKMLDGFLHKLVAKRIKNGRVTKDTIMGLRVQGLHATITQFHKFTVVELIFAGCRYHGLASMHIGDEPNDLVGIGRAYSRAFDQLLAKHQHKRPKWLPSVSCEDLRIYKRALSAEKIKKAYDAGLK